MEIIKTDIEGVVLIRPRVFADPRGYFFESYSKRLFDEQVAIPATGAPVDFVQDNESLSGYGVVRGLHYQKSPYSQSKLVRCTEGRVLDVVVDVRKGSPTYGRHVAVELSSENCLQLFIPRGFAHGFSVLSERAVFQYKCDAYYCAESEAGIQALDPSLGIDWQIPREEMLLSPKDKQRACLADLEADFHFGDKLY